MFRNLFFVVVFSYPGSQNWIRKDKNERFIHIFNKLLSKIAIKPDKIGERDRLR